MMRIVIAHSVEIWSVGMEAILTDLGYEVIGCWPNTDHALAAIDRSQADLLIIAKGLLDLSRPRGSKRPLAGRYAGKIVVVLEDGAQLSVGDFVAWDVEGLILSSASGLEFAECIADVGEGRSWLDPNVRHVLGNGKPPPPDHSGLSERELVVARLVASGMSNKAIAKALSVSDGTVKMHMHHILTKLHLPSRFDLARQFKDSLEPSEAGPNLPKLRLVSDKAVPHPSLDD